MYVTGQVRFRTSLLPAKWIRKADPFRLAQISPARRNGTRNEHKHLDRIYEK